MLVLLFFQRHVGGQIKTEGSANNEEETVIVANNIAAYLLPDIPQCCGLAFAEL